MDCFGHLIVVRAKLSFFGFCFKVYFSFFFSCGKGGGWGKGAGGGGRVRRQSTLGNNQTVAYKHYHAESEHSDRHRWLFVRLQRAPSVPRGKTRQKTHNELGA